MLLTKPITKKRAMNLVWNLHKRPRSPKKTVSVTYNLDELKKFIDGAKADGADKIRVYFGQFSKDNNRNLGHAGYDNCQTVIFVAVDGDVEKMLPDVEAGEPFDEGEICPPLKGCDTTGSLYKQALDPAINNPQISD